MKEKYALFVLLCSYYIYSQYVCIQGNYFGNENNIQLFVVNHNRSGTSACRLFGHLSEKRHEIMMSSYSVVASPITGNSTVCLTIILS